MTWLVAESAQVDAVDTPDYLLLECVVGRVEFLEDGLLSVENTSEMWRHMCSGSRRDGGIRSGINRVQEGDGAKPVENGRGNGQIDKKIKLLYYICNMRTSRERRWGMNKSLLI